MPFISLWKFSKNEMKRFSKISTIFYFLFSIFILTIEISIAQFNPIHHYNNEKNSWYNDVQYNHSALQPIYSEDTTSYQKVIATIGLVENYTMSIYITPQKITPYWM